VPLAAILIHNIIGLFFYCVVTFAPVNVGCELLSSYTINYIADHFKTWSNIFQQMTSSELGFDEAVKITNLESNVDTKPFGVL
jgi:hypothetical protein